MKRKKRRKRLKHAGGIGVGMTVLAILVISLAIGIGANDKVANIDFQSQNGRSQAMSINEMNAETETELGSNGISLEGTILIESMSASRNESDAIIRRELNGNDVIVRWVKRTDHESVAGRVSVFTGTTVTRSDHEEEGVQNNGSRMGETHLDFSRTGAGDNMVYVHHGVLSVGKGAGDNMVYGHHGVISVGKCAGDNMVYGHHGSKCGIIKGGEGSIWRPSSDGSKVMSVKEMSLEQISDKSKVMSVKEKSLEQIIDRAHFKSGSDASTGMSVKVPQMSAEYCDDSSQDVIIDRAIEVDGWLSTEDADRAEVHGWLSTEDADRATKVDSYEGESEGSVSYVERFDQRKQSLEARAYDSKSSLKVDKFGRASHGDGGLEVDEYGWASHGDGGLKTEKFGRAGNGINRQKGERTDRTGNVTANSLVKGIGRVEVSEKSVSENRVEQGRELSIARLFRNVFTDRSEVESNSDNSLDTAEERSVNGSVVNVDQGGEYYVARQSQSEQGRECCVARRSRCDLDDYEVRSEDLDNQGKDIRSVEVDERLARNEASDDQREMCIHRVEMHESVDKGRESLEKSSSGKSRNCPEKRAVVEGRLDGNSVYDNLNVKQGRVISDTRHSQDGAGAEMAENSDTELSAAFEGESEGCGKCYGYGERELCDCDKNEGRMMKHDNVKLGRVVDVAQHSHAHDYMGGAGISKASEQDGTGDIGSRDDCTIRIACEQVGMSCSRSNEILEYDCSSAVLYNGAERCIGKGAYNTETSLEKTEVKYSVDGPNYEGRVETGRQCRSSETNRYNDCESIGMWILLLIASWKVYSEEQEKYLWRERELNLNMQDKASVTNSGESSTSASASASAEVGSKIDVTRDEDGLGTVRFTQPMLKQKLKDEYDVADGRAPNTPAREGQVLVRGDGSGQLSAAEATEVRKLMRSRPERGNAVRGLALHSLIRYVTSTPNRNRGWTFCPDIVWSGVKDLEFEISGRSDSDYAAITDDRRSVTGGRTFLNRCPMLELGRVLERVIQPKHYGAGKTGLKVLGDTCHK